MRRAAANVAAALFFSATDQCILKKDQKCGVKTVSNLFDGNLKRLIIYNVDLAAGNLPAIYSEKHIIIRQQAGPRAL